MGIKTAIIPGGAGFIGVNLIKKLKGKYEKIICLDNFSLGKSDYLSKYKNDEQIEIIKTDCSDIEKTKKLINTFENKNLFGDIWHLAANSDIPSGVEDISIDLKDTFMTTFNLLSAIKGTKFNSIYFASSSAIYGDHKDEYLRENKGPLLPISNYGAMKLASEAVISAAAESYLRRAVIYRFPNVVGIPATHGVIYDFTNKLIENPNFLNVLGDGSQKKSYLHVDDLIDGMIKVWETWPNNKKIDIFNIGPKDDGIFVKEIAQIVSNNFSNNVEIIFGQGNKGWLGDVPKFFYDTNKITDLTGWSPKMNSKEAIKKSSKQIYSQLVEKNLSFNE